MKLVAELNSLRQMSVGVAQYLEEGKDVAITAALIKDMGTKFEKYVAELTRLLVNRKPSLDSKNRIEKYLAQSILHAPGFTLRGGTTEILKRNCSERNGGSMSDMRDLMVELAEKILKENCTKELIDQAEDGTWQQKLWDLLEEAGIFTIGIPEENGGTGGDYADGFHILRLIGKYAVPLPVSETLIVNWLLHDSGFQTETVPTTLSIKNDEHIHIYEKENGFHVSGTLTDVPWGRYGKSF